jgi:hypothetical protein
VYGRNPCCPLNRGALIERLSASAGEVDTALERLAPVGLLQR